MNRDAVSTVVAGLNIVIGSALALSRVMDGLLYGIQPSDPLTFAVVALVLMGVPATACMLPARRATAIDPLAALRTE